MVLLDILSICQWLKIERRSWMFLVSSATADAAIISVRRASLRFVTPRRDGLARQRSNLAAGLPSHVRIDRGELFRVLGAHRRAEVDPAWLAPTGRVGQRAPVAVGPVVEERAGVPELAG